MLPVFSNDHSELNASAPVALVTRPVQAKHYFTNFVAAFPELFAALVAAILGGKELTPWDIDPLPAETIFKQLLAMKRARGS